MRGATLAFALVVAVAPSCVELKHTQAPEDTGPPTGNGGDCSAKTSPGSSCTFAAAPSCKGLDDAGCGAAESCCSSVLLPKGKFSRGYDASETTTQSGIDVVGWQAKGAAPATMEGFYLDRFEVTVGRFRRFVEAYEAWIADKPLAGDGANENVDGTGWDPSWKTDPILSQYVAKSRAELVARFDPKTCLGASTWTDAPDANENLPIDCINWFDAFLFCTWDGGRLPTEAEWNYAAAGGEQQRAYPWSNPPSDHVFHSDHAAVHTGGDLGARDVGTLTAGDGLFGHHDLAGNVWEWVIDTCTTPCDPTTLATYVSPTSCTHCVALGGDQRILRGGSWSFNEAAARTAYRNARPPQLTYNDIGVRCARNLLQ